MKLEHRLMNAYYTPYFCILNNVHNKNVFKILRILYRSWPSDIYPRPERLVQHLKINVMRVKFAQSCPTLGNPIDYAVHGILQARILEWVAIPFPRGSSQPRDRPRSPTLQVDSLPTEPPGKPKNTGVGSLSLLQGSSQPRNWTRISCIAGKFFTKWAVREAEWKQDTKD